MEKIKSAERFNILFSKIHLKYIMIIPKIEELDSPKKKGILYIRKHYPEFCDYILRTYPHINKFNAGIYLYFNQMEHPLCPVCGNPTPFLDETRGFQTYCSSKCAANSKSTKEKRVSTNLKKYGAKTAAESEAVKQKLIKTYTDRHGGMGSASKSVKQKHNQTMIARYGSVHALKIDQFREKSKQTKLERYGDKTYTNRVQAKQTNLERYGTEQPLACQEIRDKIISTNLQKYGCHYPAQSEEIKQKISKTHCKSFMDIHTNILEAWKDGDILMYRIECPHPECQRCTEKSYIIPAERYCNRRIDGTEPCTILVPMVLNRIKNTSLEVFIQGVLDEIGRLQCVNCNDRTLIGPQELDIYDPLAGLAFECNGCYWHSKKGPKYHYNKWKACQQKGIQLISIWEDWIKRKPEIIKSIIKSKYGVFERCIYARKCEVRSIDSHTANTFLEANHIQGKSNAKYRYGLYNGDELVSVMTFTKQRACMGHKSNDWELVRFCNLINTKIIGSASRLLKHFIREIQPEQVISFSSNDISDGSLYKTLGFEKCGEANAYWYIDPDYKRYHRTGFTKSSIIKRGMAPERAHWTELEVMLAHGFVRIFDSGQTKWVLKKENF